MTLQDWPVNQGKCEHVEWSMQMWGMDEASRGGPSPYYICYCSDCLMLWNPDEAQGYGLEGRAKLLDLFLWVNS